MCWRAGRGAWGLEAVTVRAGFADDAFPGLDGEAVAAFVLGVVVVAANPVEGEVVDVSEVVEDAPEVFVLDGLLCGGAPASGLPLVEPFLEAVEDVLAVGPDLDAGGSFDGAETFDDGAELHAIVGGLGVTA